MGLTGWRWQGTGEKKSIEGQEMMVVRCEAEPACSKRIKYATYTR